MQIPMKRSFYHTANEVAKAKMEVKALLEQNIGKPPQQLLFETLFEEKHMCIVYNAREGGCMVQLWNGMKRTVVIIISISQNKIQPVSMEYLDDRSLDGCLPGPE